MSNKTTFNLLAVLTAMIAMVSFSTSFINAELVTMRSSEVINAYEYGTFAAKFGVYEDSDLAIIPLSDIPFLAHYENTNTGTFKFQEWLEHEDELTVNEFEDEY